jgi:hypothetical protein
MAEIQSCDVSSDGEDVKLQNFFIATRNANTSINTLKDNLAVSYKSKQSLIIQCSYSRLAIYPKDLKTYMHTKTAHKIL